MLNKKLLLCGPQTLLSSIRNFSLTTAKQNQHIRRVTLIPGNFPNTFINSSFNFSGDGIGPEISAAVQKIFESAKTPIEWVSFWTIKTFNNMRFLGPG